MRMKELARRSDLPRTTIQYYLREKLLPEPERTARNAAVYSEEHLEHLRLIQHLRSPAGGRLPLAQVRRVLELVSEGVDVDLAIGLQRAVLGEGLPDQTELMDLAEVVRRSGVEEAEVRRLVAASIVIPALEDEELFDAADLELLATYARLRSEIDLRFDEVAGIARRIGEVSRIEWALRERAVDRLDSSEAARRSLDLQRAGNLVHSYLFARNRQRSINALHTADGPQDRSDPR
jgi:DNA-binding transcriptional MerR regulator